LKNVDIDVTKIIAEMLHMVVDVKDSAALHRAETAG